MTNDTAKAQLWASRLDRFRRSGLSISQLCRNEKINLQVFNYWRKKLETIVLSPTPSVTLNRTLAADASGVRFLIEARGIKIEFQSRSLEAINNVLAWATQHQESGFKQLVVRD
ncbi:MAG: hypothetical protein MUC43_08485 [Pirellula sp.]|jgi:hypothetical protein|nr:hypothetical protein [Pirellula sp.]